jgi:hypothetical protein
LTQFLALPDYLVVLLESSYLIPFNHVNLGNLAAQAMESDFLVAQSLRLHILLFQQETLRLFMIQMVSLPL